MSAYDDYMAIPKRQAQAGSLQQALEALRSAQEIDDNDKVRRRIKKIREAIEAEEETSEEESDVGESSKDDSGFQVCKSNKLGRWSFCRNSAGGSIETTAILIIIFRILKMGSKWIKIYTIGYIPTKWKVSSSCGTIYTAKESTVECFRMIWVLEKLSKVRFHFYDSL